MALPSPLFPVFSWSEDGVSHPSHDHGVKDDTGGRAARDAPHRALGAGPEFLEDGGPACARGSQESVAEPHEMFWPPCPGPRVLS